MSAPVSAMMTPATFVEIPGIVEIRSRASRKGVVSKGERNALFKDNFDGVPNQMLGTQTCLYNFGSEVCY
jgi:hypothetical protein